MEYEEIEFKKGIVIRLNEKRLDALIADTFKKIIGNIVENNNYIILNLKNVNFVDSSGLGSLVSILKKIGKNGDLLICNVNSNILSMFKLTRMDRIFKIFENEEDAIKSLGK